MSPQAHYVSRSGESFFIVLSPPTTLPLRPEVHHEEVVLARYDRALIGLNRMAAANLRRRQIIYSTTSGLKKENFIRHMRVSSLKHRVPAQPIHGVVPAPNIVAPIFVHEGRAVKLTGLSASENTESDGALTVAILTPHCRNSVEGPKTPPAFLSDLLGRHPPRGNCGTSLLDRAAERHDAHLSRIRCRVRAHLDSVQRRATEALHRRTHVLPSGPGELCVFSWHDIGVPAQCGNAAIRERLEASASTQARQLALEARVSHARNEMDRHRCTSPRRARRRIGLSRLRPPRACSFKPREIHTVHHTESGMSWNIMSYDRPGHKRRKGGLSSPLRALRAPHPAPTLAQAMLPVIYANTTRWTQLVSVRERVGALLQYNSFRAQERRLLAGEIRARLAIIHINRVDTAYARSLRVSAARSAAITRTLRQVAERGAAAHERLTLLAEDIYEAACVFDGKATPLDLRSEEQHAGIGSPI